MIDAIKQITMLIKIDIPPGKYGNLLIKVKNIMAQTGICTKYTLHDALPRNTGIPPLSIFYLPEISIPIITK